MCIVLATEEKTEMNSKEERSAQNFKSLEQSAYWLYF